jgi:cytochrome c-type biogenesis protein CcmH
LISGTALAQQPAGDVTDDDVNRVSRELYCPVCENIPLDVCETQACVDWRQLVREMLIAGQSDQDIIDYFAEEYGERARATPTTRGPSLVIWIAPLVGAVVGVAYFSRVLRRWLAAGAAGDDDAFEAPDDDAQASGPEIDEYAARLEQEIQESS